MADWDDAALAAADEKAIEVARRIYDQEFWPPATKTPDILTEYAAICQDLAFRRNLEEDVRDGDHHVSRFSHVLISASAGTGKTFQLSNRYIGLLHSGVMPDQILATTFTRKAAGEILDRVIVRLAEAALDSRKRQELAKWLQVAALPSTRCHEMLRQMLRQLHRLRVSTLDAFFAQLAGSFSLELGLPPGGGLLKSCTKNTSATKRLNGLCRETPHTKCSGWCT